MANPYMCDYYIMQDRITGGYDALACQLAPANVAPVGEGFRYIRDNYGVEAFQALYQSDPTDDHPTEQANVYFAKEPFTLLIWTFLRAPISLPAPTTLLCLVTPVQGIPTMAFHHWIVTLQ